MGSDYRIPIDNGSKDITLEVGESSNKFDLTIQVGSSGLLDLAHDLTPEQLANVAFELLKVALYWAGDVDAFRAWLHKRVDEADHSGFETAYR